MRHLKKAILVLILFVTIGLLNINIDKTEEIIVKAQPNDERMLKAVWVTPFIGDVAVNGEISFKTNMTNVLNNMDALGYNALIFHVRTHNNAFYPSSLNPKASYISNINFNTFDPIEWLITEAHNRGIEFHAWMNPYRIGTQYTGNMPSANPASNPGNIISGTNNAQILDPAKTVVKDFVADTIKEFIEMYDVDAIHFDDYFYISGLPSSYPYNDNERRGHVNDMIERVSNTLKTHNANNNKFVQLGISPTGIYRNGSGSITEYDGKVWTTGTAGTSGQQHYEGYLFADTVHWMNERWIDYIMPQIYWNRNHSAAPYQTVLNWWSKVTSYLDTNLYVGLGLYRSDQKGSSGEWGYNSYELDAQITAIENDSEAKGYSMFSYKQLNNPSGDFKTQLDNAYNGRPDRKKISVLPELKGMTPVIPSETQTNHNSGVLSWSHVDEAKFYYIYRSTGTLTYSTNELYAVVGKDIYSYNTGDTNNTYNYGVKVLSGTNHLSGESSGGGPSLDYTINFNLNGGSFSGYNTKTSLATSFLTDLYNFINPSENLNTFMHGAGKTSGFGGTWFSNEAHRGLIYGANIKSGNNNYFASSFAYQSKWKPFFDMMVNFVKAGNPDQDFWSSPHTGTLRMSQYFTNVKPGPAWSNEDMNMMPEGLGQSVPTSYKSTSPTITLPTITKEGSTFGGWYTNPSFSGTPVTTIPTGSTGNKTFYAKWNEQNFTITYNLNGGNLASSGYNSRDEMLMAFFTDYHAFVKPGVSLNDFVHGAGKTSGYGGNYNNVDYFNMLYSPNNKAINAGTGKFINQPEYNKWVPLFDLIDDYVRAVNNSQNFWGSTYTGQLRFKPFMQKDLYGKSETEDLVNKVPDGLQGSSVLYEYNSSTPTYTLPIPTKNNEEFLGWYTNSSFTGSKVTSITKGSTGNKTFYAKWEGSTPTPTKATVSFDLAYNGLTLPSVEVTLGNKVTKPSNPTRSGYTFLGWYSNGSLYDFNKNVNNDITLIAGWSLNEPDPDQVTVYFDLRYDGLSLPSKSVDRGTKVTKPTNPSRPGYTFIGWYFGDNLFNFNTNITYNLTLNAKWEVNFDDVDCIDVVFDYGYNGTSHTTQVERGNKVIKPADPRRDGYIFKGWYFIGNLYDFNSSVDYSITLVAQWESDGITHDYVTVTFDQGYNNIKSTTQVIRNNAVTKPADPTRSGYIFKGWHFVNNIYDFNNPVMYDITLIAQWEVDSNPQVTIIFDEGYDNNRHELSIPVGGLAPEIGDPRRPGYTFEGWYLGNQLYNFNTPVNSNITLVARWTNNQANKITITFDYGYMTDYQVIDKNTIPVKPTDPMRPGQDFIGWYLDNERYNFNTSISNDVTLVAVWSGEYINVTFMVDGKEHNNVEVIENTKVNMPLSPYKEDYIFDGWYLGNNKYNFNDNVSNNLTLVARFVELKDLDRVAGYKTPEVETIDGGKGLKYTGIIERKYRNKEHGFYLVFGTTSLDELTNALSTNNIINDKEVYKVVLKGIRKDGSFSVILTGIPTHAYNQKITVIPYMVDKNITYYASGFMVSTMNEAISITTTNIPFIVEKIFVKVVKNKEEEQ